MTAKKKRGFAAMDAEEQKQIAAMGGRIAQERGLGHTFTKEEAKQAAMKGGRSLVEKRGSEYMRELGRKGAAARKAKKAKLEEEGS